jgi:hypothetical protein
MSMRSRVKRLEVVTVKKLKRRLEEFPEETCRDYWAKLGRQGYFKGEPDFPVALEFFRNALAKAAAQTHPPWNPPYNFFPPESGRDRLRKWRYPDRFPEVLAASCWLMEMYIRIRDGISPVTEAEFNDLVRWFRDHLSELGLLPDSPVFYSEDGWSATPIEILDGLHTCWRTIGAGDLAEDLRHVKRRYEERLGDGTPTQQLEGSGVRQTADAGRGMDPDGETPPAPPVP